MEAKEEDGKDEGIVAYDNILVIDDILKNICLKVQPGVRLVCFFDCCHSGTMLDLPVVYRDGKIVSLNTDQNSEKNLSVLCYSGCKDNQVALETFDKSTKQVSGAFTDSVLEILENKSVFEKSDLSFLWKYPRKMCDYLNIDLQRKKFEQNSVLSMTRFVWETNK